MPFVCFLVHRRQMQWRVSLLTLRCNASRLVFPWRQESARKYFWTLACHVRQDKDVFPAIGLQRHSLIRALFRLVLSMVARADAMRLR